MIKIKKKIINTRNTSMIAPIKAFFAIILTLLTTIGNIRIILIRTTRRLTFKRCKVFFVTFRAFETFFTSKTFITIRIAYIAFIIKYNLVFFITFYALIVVKQKKIVATFFTFIFWGTNITIFCAFYTSWRVHQKVIPRFIAKFAWKFSWFILK